ncbi:MULTISPECIES: FadR/GntR family transcriptional regulator [Marinobacter]|uniref:FadR/GntR family transcriptional regulator n=1 Tax=Marinobacter TaxID=2742 RepID=UPI001D1726EE|nr:MULTISPECIES: FadR/GntR family transcriptional regulator [Marinobacter]
MNSNTTVKTKAPKSPQRASVADFLAEAIFSGRYRPGDFVPKEIDLCEQLGINRPAVRSDLRQLVDSGIIERISGHGSKVREYDAWHILDPQVTDWMTRYAAPNPEILKEILSFRLDVEPYVAMTAAKSAKARDLVAIEEAFEGMSRTVDHSGDDGDAHSEFDVAFHEAIFRATHNIVWTQLSHILRPSIYLLIARSNVHTADPAESLERHRRVMDAIRARQPREAFLAAQDVLASTAAALGIEMPETALGHDPGLA